MFFGRAKASFGLIICLGTNFSARRRSVMGSNQERFDARLAGHGRYFRRSRGRHLMFVRAPDCFYFIIIIFFVPTANRTFRFSPTANLRRMRTRRTVLTTNAKARVPPQVPWVASAVTSAMTKKNRKAPWTKELPSGRPPPRAPRRRPSRPVLLARRRRRRLGT